MQKDRKGFVWVQLRNAFWLMVALWAANALSQWTARDVWWSAPLLIVWLASGIFVFVTAIIHLSKYRQKALAITALILSTWLLASGVIGLLFGTTSSLLAYETDRADVAAETVNEYQRHIDSVTEGLNGLEAPLNKWNILMEQRNKGNEVDPNDLAAAQRDYADKANIANTRIESAKRYIHENEETLKEAGLDTFKETQTLDELSAGIENNVRNMQETIDNLTGQ